MFGRTTSKSERSSRFTTKRQANISLEHHRAGVRKQSRHQREIRLYKLSAKIGAFYFVLYSCLAAFFAVCLTVFLVTIPSIEEGPRFSNIITESLGVGIAPRPSKKVSISYVREHDLAPQRLNTAKKIKNALYRKKSLCDDVTV